MRWPPSSRSDVCSSPASVRGAAECWSVFAAYAMDLAVPGVNTVAPRAHCCRGRTVRLPRPDRAYSLGEKVAMLPRVLPFVILLTA